MSPSSRLCYVFVVLVLASLSESCKNDPAPLSMGGSCGSLGAAVNITEMGAEPDDERDDAAAIQAALDAVQADGGTVCVPHGVFRVERTVVLRGNGVTLRGLGRGSSLVLAPSPQAGVLMNGASRSMIENLHITGAGAACSGDGFIAVRARFCTDCVVRNLVIQSVWGGISIEASRRAQVLDNQIEDVQTGIQLTNDGAPPEEQIPMVARHVISGNTIERYGRCAKSGTGINVWLLSEVTVERNRTLGVSKQSGGGIFLTGAFWTTVRGNTIDQAENGIQYVTIGNHSVEHNIIEQNLVRGVHPEICCGSGISLQADAGTMAQAIIANNIIRSNHVYSADYGIALTNPTGISISRNLIDGNIVRDSTNLGILVQAASHNTVSLNHVLSSTDEGIKIDSQIAASSVPATHNLVFGNQVSFSGASGISIEGGCDGTSLSSNIVRENGRHGIVIRESPVSQIVNNQVLSNGGAMRDTYAAICISGGMRYQVHGNTVSSEGAERHGILADNASEVSATGNVVYGSKMLDNRGCPR